MSLIAWLPTTETSLLDTVGLRGDLLRYVTFCPNPLSSIMIDDRYCCAGPENRNSKHFWPKNVENVLLFIAWWCNIVWPLKFFLNCIRKYFLCFEYPIVLIVDCTVVIIDHHHTKWVQQCSFDIMNFQVTGSPRHSILIDTLHCNVNGQQHTEVGSKCSILFLFLQQHTQMLGVILISPYLEKMKLLILHTFWERSGTVVILSHWVQIITWHCNNVTMYIYCRVDLQGHHLMMFIVALSIFSECR